MGRDVGTVRSPQQVCQDMFLELARIQGDLKERFGITSRGKIDKKVFSDSELLSTDLYKFFDSLFRSIYEDAKRISAMANNNPSLIPQVEANLESLHELFEEAHKSYRYELKKAHFFWQFTHKLDGLIRNQIKGIKRLERKHGAKVVAEMRKSENSRKEAGKEARPGKKGVVIPLFTKKQRGNVIQLPAKMKRAA
ncbi:MAG: hypothetical protein ABIJ08_07125 [Nanoarchaeota archaeon]